MTKAFNNKNCNTFEIHIAKKLDRLMYNSVIFKVNEKIRNTEGFRGNYYFMLSEVFEKFIEII